MDGHWIDPAALAVQSMITRSLARDAATRLALWRPGLCNRLLLESWKTALSSAPCTCACASEARAPGFNINIIHVNGVTMATMATSWLYMYKKRSRWFSNQLIISARPAGGCPVDAAVAWLGLRFAPRQGWRRGGARGPLGRGGARERGGTPRRLAI